ncbi:MAG: type II secretion system major pseudopilin GspG [Gammaproteobacteria bacterium]|nr:type II secretion system major pseudopilin GspG [Gammaproteobacteria bacterium]
MESSVKKIMPKQQQGFTLIEIIVVVVIIGILATLIAPKFLGRTDEARVVKAQQDIQALESALDLYKLDNYSYPTTEQGLEALVSEPSSDPAPANWKSGGYIKKLSKDPWQREYMYLYPGEHGELDLYSLGADGIEGGDGPNADIGNWSTD